MTIFSQLSTLYGPSEVNLNTASEYLAVPRSDGTPDGTPAPEDLGECPVAVLSAALLQAVMDTLALDPGGFAEQAGVATEVVAGAVTGTCPAWALPYGEFAALADAVAALWPGEVFETAAACDLLMSCVLNGDEVMATDVLAQPRCHGLARVLLKQTLVSGLLPEDALTLLIERATSLSGSRSPDAWIGEEILSLHDTAIMSGQFTPKQRPAAEPAGGAATKFWTGRMNANGTAWRMRSLVAMGHDAPRIARALDVTPELVRRLIRGDCASVTLAFHLSACRLWDAWWDKTPPERTGPERLAASRARNQARNHDWPAAAGLDEDLLDRPGYRPSCHYRPATGTGTAPDLDPRGIRHPAPKKSRSRQGEHVTTRDDEPASYDGSELDALLDTAMTGILAKLEAGFDTNAGLADIYERSHTK